jgi:hypothetical protein
MNTPRIGSAQLVFDVLHEPPLGAGILELRLRDVPAPIFVNLLNVDDERGAAADWASRSSDGTAFFQIAAHCSGFSAAEGRPDVMVFVCANAEVAVNGSRGR